MHSDSDPEIHNEIVFHKELLDRLHKDKIEISRAVFVVDVDGYIGESTASEIKHAEDRKIPIYYYSKGDLVLFVKTTNLKTLNK